MSEPIKVGDLVQVVRPTKCCGDTSCLGDIFRVAWLGLSEGTTNCCDQELPDEPAADEYPEDDGNCFALYMLKRIPPLGELDDVKQDEEITA